MTMSPSIFTAFLDWLGPRSANGTVVRTVGEVMGGALPAQLEHPEVFLRPAQT
jgi:hypothetical protein